MIRGAARFLDSGRNENLAKDNPMMKFLRRLFAGAAPETNVDQLGGEIDYDGR